MQKLNLITNHLIPSKELQKAHQVLILFCSSIFEILYTVDPCFGEL